MTIQFNSNNNIKVSEKLKAYEVGNFVVCIQ